jgi:hypothetical protein
MLHYGVRSDLSEHGIDVSPITDYGLCAACDEVTTQACPGCHSEGKTVYVCSSGECMDAHEDRHNSILSPAP